MDWMKFYYANPSPERFVEELRAVVKSGAIDKPATQIVFATFFGRVIAANASRASSWFSELADLQGAGRETLHLAAWMSATTEGRDWLVDAGAHPRMLGPAPDLLSRRVDDPTVLDMLWAYYCATGDARAVRRIVSAFELLDDYGAAARFKSTAQTAADKTRALNDAIFQAASWSLGSFMTEHPPLLATCEQMFESPELSPNERLSLAMTLQKVAPDTWDVQIDSTTGTSRVSRKNRPQV